MAKSKRRRGSGNPGDGLLINAGTAAAIALLGLVVSFGLVWWQAIQEPALEEAAFEREHLADQYALLLNGRIGELRAVVDAIGAAPDTEAILADYDRTAARAYGAKVAGHHPNVLRVDVIPRGEAEVDLNAAVPISFAALDLIRRAETQEFVGPEVSLNQRNLIYAARPVTLDGVVAGAMLVVFDRQFFIEPLALFAGNDGTVEIVQRFEGTPQTVVMQWGAGDDSVAAVERPLIANHWSIHLRRSLDTFTRSDATSKLWMPAAIALLVTLAAIFLGLNRYTRQVRDDAQTLTEYATRVARGRPATAGKFKLSALADVSKALAPYAKGGESRPDRSKPDEEDDDLLAGLDDDDGDAVDNAASPPEASKNDFLEVTKAIPDDNFGIEVSEGPATADLDLDQGIFRAYDIRGITTRNLTEEVVYWIGRAFAAQAISQGRDRIAVGWDGRLSSVALKTSLIRGLTESGADVLSIGQVPTPVLYFATHELDTGTGIMITGSHNPPEYNGLKMMIAGVTLAEDKIQALYQRIVQGDLGEDHSEDPGAIEDVDLDMTYIDRVLDEVGVAQSLKVVVDCGNGVAGEIAPRLLQELGCEVIPLYCEVDGNFPNHHPDPAEPENLEDLMTVVQAENADIGLAFDGDGDRVGVVTNTGKIIWPDKFIMLFAQDIVSRNPGADIIYDVKCSRHLNTLISDMGGRPIMWKTGHSHIKAKIKETGALLGGEFSGHICFAERWYGFDDALYSAARLLEIIASDGRTVDELFAQFPETVTTPELKIETTEEAKFEVMGRLEVEGQWGEGTLTTIDGIRVDYADSWGLIRPSNTSPVLSLRFEADTEEALDRVQDVFRTQLARVDDTLTF